MRWKWIAKRPELAGILINARGPLAHPPYSWERATWSKSSISWEDQFLHSLDAPIWIVYKKVKRLEDSILHSLLSGVMAGSPCPIEVMKQVMTKLHMPQVTVSRVWRAHDVTRTWNVTHATNEHRLFADVFLVRRANFPPLCATCYGTHNRPLVFFLFFFQSNHRKARPIHLDLVSGRIPALDTGCVLFYLFPLRMFPALDTSSCFCWVLIGSLCYCVCHDSPVIDSVLVRFACFVTLL